MNRRGFTLIDLLVVIAKVRENARKISCASNLRQLGIGITQCTQDYDAAITLWQHRPDHQPERNRLGCRLAAANDPPPNTNNPPNSSPKYATGSVSGGPSGSMNDCQDQNGNEAAGTSNLRLIANGSPITLTFSLN